MVSYLKTNAPVCAYTVSVCGCIRFSWGSDLRLSYRNSFVCVFTENLCAFVNGESLIGHMQVVLSACLMIITWDETEMHGCIIQNVFSALCHRGTLIFLSETRYNDLFVGIFQGRAFKVSFTYTVHTWGMRTIAVCCVFVRLPMDLDWYLGNASPLSKCHSLVNICHSSFTLLSAGVYCIDVAVRVHTLTCMFAYGIQSIRGRMISRLYIYI